MSSSQPLLLLIQIAVNFLTVMQFVIFLAVIFSWFPNANRHPVVQYIRRIAEPIFAQIRKFMPRTGMIDFSPLVALLLLNIIVGLLRGLAVQMA